MPQFVPVSLERHAAKVWRRPTNYTFAAAEATTSLVGLDLARTALFAPIAFVEQSGRYVPIAVMSPTPGSNLFVGPDGQWLGDYIPVSFRTYPFRSVPRDDSEEAIVCFDEGSGLLDDDLSAGETFFDSDGAPSETMKTLINILRDVEVSRKAAGIATSALADAGVIQPWDLKLKLGEAERAIQGLYRIDESVMTRLSDKQFLKLRKASALSVAYAQLLSIGQLDVFGRLVKLQEGLTQQTLGAAVGRNWVENSGDELLRFD